jgi:hypothetical protein
LLRLCCCELSGWLARLPSKRAGSNATATLTLLRKLCPSAFDQVEADATKKKEAAAPAGLRKSATVTIQAGGGTVVTALPAHGAGGRGGQGGSGTAGSNCNPVMIGSGASPPVVDIPDDVKLLTYSPMRDARPPANAPLS